MGSAGSTNRTAMSFFWAISVAASIALRTTSGRQWTFRSSVKFAACGAIQLEKVFDQPELEEGVALDHLDRAGDLSRIASAA